MSRRPARAGAPEGGLVVDKAAGLTSHDVVALARRALGQPRIGHTGTLDPMATGVLPLLLGRATRLARFLAADRKTYEAAVRFGQSTSTYDAEGTPVGPAARDLPDRAAIEAALDRFRGRFDQMPPAVSAKKVGGHRAYALARAAQPVTLAAGDRRGHAGWSSQDSTVRSRRSSSTARRASTFGRWPTTSAVRWVSAAHLAALRRTRSGRFTLDDSVSIQRIVEDSDEAGAQVIGMADLLPDLPAQCLSSTAAAGVATRASSGGLGRDSEWRVGPAVSCASWTPEGRLAAVAEARGRALHPLVVLL